jgi:hypothetical protein
MDDSVTANERLSDVSAAERTRGASWREGRRPSGSPRRKKKNAGPDPTTMSRTESPARAQEEGGDTSGGPDDATPADEERSATRYGRDRTIASALPPKGRIIDTAV